MPFRSCNKTNWRAEKCSHPSDCLNALSLSAPDSSLIWETCMLETWDLLPFSWGWNVHFYMYRMPSFWVPWSPQISSYSKTAYNIIKQNNSFSFKNENKNAENNFFYLGTWWKRLVSTNFSKSLLSRMSLA